ncbi:hypothetical protein [Paenibacillus pinihumi]|uniref:hypothetical protein n=1 Tax=Paenibacillus pinihumi TaxID=669462 RepID=UPI000409F3F1|nr:hypothetical protein [Paenibacillus pinihumi]
MKIGRNELEQIVVTRKVDGVDEVIAIISDDNEWIVKDGYSIELMPVPEGDFE